MRDISSNQVDIAKARKEAERHNFVAKTYIEIYTAIMDILKKFDGKDISIRIDKAFKADPRLAGYNIHTNIVAGMHQISFWGGTLDYEERNHLHIGYTDQGKTINLDKIRESNQGFMNSRIIDLDTFDERVVKWNKMVKEAYDFLRTEADDISYIINKG